MSSGLLGNAEVGLQEKRWSYHISVYILRTLRGIIRMLGAKDSNRRQPRSLVHCVTLHKGGMLQLLMGEEQ